MTSCVKGVKSVDWLPVALCDFYGSFSSYVKCSPDEASCCVNMVQPSAKTDMAASNNVDPVPLTVDFCSLESV